MKTNFTTEEHERYERYRSYLNGAWFASSLPDMEDWAQEKCEEKILKPVSSLPFVSKPENAKGFYVPVECKTPQDFLNYFSVWALNHFGCFETNLDFQI